MIQSSKKYFQGKYTNLTKLYLLRTKNHNNLTHSIFKMECRVRSTITTTYWRGNLPTDLQEVLSSLLRGFANIPDVYPLRFHMVDASLS